MKNHKNSIFYKILKKLKFSSNKKIKNFLFFKKNFFNKTLKYRIKKKNFLNKEKIVKAIGLKNKKNVIFDLTAGFGKDSFILASAGFKVCMVENNPIIALFLLNTLEKIKKKKKYFFLYKNIKFIFSNSINLLIKKKIKPKIIYLDPMFKNYNKKSLPKKNIYLLRKIVKYNNKDFKKLFLESLKSSKKLILKRFFKDKKLYFKKPKNIIYTKSKKYRFEIY